MKFKVFLPFSFSQLSQRCTFLKKYPIVPQVDTYLGEVSIHTDHHQYIQEQKNTKKSGYISVTDIYGQKKKTVRGWSICSSTLNYDGYYNTQFAWEKNTLSNWRPLKDDPDRYGKYLCYFSKISATLCRQQHHNILKSQDLT